MGIFFNHIHVKRKRPFALQTLRETVGLLTEGIWNHQINVVVSNTCQPMPDLTPLLLSWISSIKLTLQKCPHIWIHLGPVLGLRLYGRIDLVHCGLIATWLRRVIFLRLGTQQSI